MEQERPVFRTERQVAQLVEDDRLDVRHPLHEAGLYPQADPLACALPRRPCLDRERLSANDRLLAEAGQSAPLVDAPAEPGAVPFEMVVGHNAGMRNALAMLVRLTAGRNQFHRRRWAVAVTKVGSWLAFCSRQMGCWSRALRCSGIHLSKVIDHLQRFLFTLSKHCIGNASLRIAWDVTRTRFGVEAP